MDDNNELIIYVLQQLRYGVPEQTVRQTLAQNGWPQPLIDRAFSMVQQAAPHNVPPTSYEQQAQPQATDMNLPVAAELPTPAADPYPAIEEKQRIEKRSGILRSFVITIVVLVSLAAAAFGGYLVYKAVKQHSNKPSQAATIQTKSADAQRKDSISSLVTDLTKYYSAKETYPSLAQINGADFASKEDGFSVTKYKDPKWDADKTKACVSPEGLPIFADSRSENCFSYRVTAINGADCDAIATKCTRVVLTANLDGNKPYVVALDQNKKE